MLVDPSTLLTFCRAVEDTADAGLVLFTREDLLRAAEALEALKEEVDRALVRLSSLVAPTVH
jgi:hypothetical protein